MRLAARLRGVFRRAGRGPLTFIAAMPRSGSTMLAGLLTRPGRSVILSEPGFHRGLHENAEQFFEVAKVSIAGLARYRGRPQRMLAAFRRKILPQIEKHYPRVGVKECFLDDWQLYEQHFEQIRYVVLARDPRDVMLSVLEYGRRVPWHRKMWADKPDEYIAGRHNAVWQQQKQMLRSRGAFALRYEDMCTGTAWLGQLCDFLELELDEPGNTSGVLLTSYAWRRWEVQRHGSGVSRRTVFRWKNEPQGEPLRRALHVGRLMSEYCQYWGYDTPGTARGRQSACA